MAGQDSRRSDWGSSNPRKYSCSTLSVGLSRLLGDLRRTHPNPSQRDWKRPDLMTLVGVVPHTTKLPGGWYPHSQQVSIVDQRFSFFRYTLQHRK